MGKSFSRTSLSFQNIPRELHLSALVLLYIVVFPPFFIVIFFLSKIDLENFYLFVLQSTIEAVGFLIVPVLCLLPFSICSFLWIAYSVGQYRIYHEIEKGTLPKPKQLFLYQCQHEPTTFPPTFVNIEGYSIKIGKKVKDLEGTGWDREFRRGVPAAKTYSLFGTLDWIEDEPVLSEGYMWRGSCTLLPGIAIYLAIRPLCIINVVPLFFLVHTSSIFFITYINFL